MQAANAPAAVSLALTGPIGTVRAGTAITLTVAINGTASTNAAAVQFSIPSMGWTETPTIGTSESGTPAKTIQCAIVSGQLNCIVYGLNSNPLADGTLATLSVTLPRNLATGTTSLSLTNTLAADNNGSTVTVGAAAPFALSTVSVCDVNGDGTVTAADMTAALPYYLQQSTCTPVFDLNSDGVCNVLDLQILATAIGGGACNAKQD